MVGNKARLVDEAGTTVALATVDELPDSKVGAVCHVGFTMSDVAEAKFYTLTVGDATVGEWSAADLDAVGWSIAADYTR